VAALHEHCEHTPTGSSICMHLIELCPQGPPPTQTAKATFAQRAHLMNDIPRGYGVVRGAIGLKKKKQWQKKTAFACDEMALLHKTRRGNHERTTDRNAYEPATRQIGFLHRTLCSDGITGRSRAVQFRLLSHIVVSGRHVVFRLRCDYVCPRKCSSAHRG